MVDCYSPHVLKITHSLKLVDYLHVQADNPWHNYCLFHYSMDSSLEQISVSAASIRDFGTYRIYE